MKKLLSYFSIIMLAATIMLTSCGQQQQAETEKEVPLKVTYSIDCSRDLLDLCDVVVTYKGDDGVDVIDTITSNPADSAWMQTWSKTVGTHKIPVKIGFDYTLVQKTDTLVTESEWISLVAKGSIIAEKIGIRKGIAHLSEKVINSKTNFYVDCFIMTEDVVNNRHDLATIIDIYNDRQAYKRGAPITANRNERKAYKYNSNNSHTCFIVKSNPYVGNSLMVEKARWNED